MSTIQTRWAQRDGISLTLSKWTKSLKEGGDETREEEADENNLLFGLFLHARSIPYPRVSNQTDQLYPAYDHGHRPSRASGGRKKFIDQPFIVTMKPGEEERSP